MFKLLKKVFISKTNKQRLLDTIDEQYSLIDKFKEYSPNSDESQELININIEQLRANIDDLSKTFGELLSPLKNKYLNLKEYIELLRYPIPINAPGFCIKIEANINSDNPEFVYPPNYTFYAKPTSYDYERYRTKLNILNHRKLAPKFEKLFYTKLKQKIGKTLFEFDNAGFQYIEKNKIDLIEQVDLIQFQRSAKDINKLKTLPLAIVKDDFQGLWEYLVECSNLKCVFVFTKKKDLMKIIKGKESFS